MRTIPDLPLMRAYMKNYEIKVILTPIQLSSFQSRVITSVQSNYLLRALIQMFNIKCSSVRVNPGSCCVQAAPEHRRQQAFFARDEEKKKPSLQTAHKESQDGHQCSWLEEQDWSRSVE